MNERITLEFADPIAKEYKWFAWYPVTTADRGIRWRVPVYKRKYVMHSYLNAPIDTLFVYSVEKGILG